MVKKLPYKDFLRSFKFAPRLTIELIVENKDKELLLLKRESKPFKNYWHLPGGYLLKDEKIANCVKRIAKDELDLRNASKYKELGVFETIKGDPRGHIIHYVVKLRRERARKGKFFKTIPKGTVAHQKKFLLKLGYTEMQG
jgi:ADP-ribose pyrophosphatase YjhB (NUDIX family)